MTDEIPGDWSRDGDQADIETVIERIGAEADRHGGEYAAGLRHARLIAEETQDGSYEGKNTED